MHQPVFAAVGSGIGRTAASDGKPGPRNDEGEKKCYGSDDEVRFDYAQRLALQIRRILAGCLEGRDLRVAEFDAGKDEGCADGNATDRSQWIEGLGEVETSFGSVGIAELGDEGVRGGLKKGESA